MLHKYTIISQSEVSRVCLTAALALGISGAAFAQGGVCATPAALAADSIGLNTAVLRFAGGGAGVGYTVTTTPATRTYSLPSGATTIRLRGLQAAASYTVALVRECGGGQTSMPSILSIATTGLCDGPNDVQPGIIGSTTANIFFGPGTPVRDYTVVLTRIQQGISSIEVGRYTVTESPLLLTGLLPSTLYGVTFYANCLNGSVSGGTGGAGIPFTTLPATLSTSARRPVASFTVYPNPARSSIMLQLPASAPSTGLNLQLLDATGRAVYTQPANFNASGSLTLPLPPQPAGWYVLRLQGPDGYQANQPLVLQ